MEKLQQDYEFSREVAARQIQNSTAFDLLERDEQWQLESITRQYI